MDRALFGTDGIRGLAGEYPLNQEGCLRIGRAVGVSFAWPGQRVLIGYDPRESSEAIVRALAEGLNSVGVNVVSVGVITTPGLAYLTREKAEFVAGVMVTASHNSHEYNGIKVFDTKGGKLSDGDEAKLNKLIKEDVTPEGGKGSIAEDKSLIKAYEDFLVGSAGETRMEGLRVAVDSANGSASGIAQRVFARLGAEVRSFADSPDGRNINDGCGATDTKALCQAVVQEKLDLGIALDGDADRLVMVDGQGRECNGDYLMYLLAVSAGLDGVVATVMSNLGFEQALKAKGITLKRTAVGDRYVLEVLKETGYKLGGEQSGHIIFPDLLMTGDGLLAAVQVLKALAESQKSLAEWRDEVKILPQALVNLPLNDKTMLDEPMVQTFLSEQTDQLAGQGRLLIRPSGTEPLVRVMVEAPDAPTLARRIADELQQILVRLEQK